MNSAQSSSWQTVPMIQAQPCEARRRRDWFWHRLGVTKRASPPPGFPAKIVRRNIILMTLGYALFIAGIVRVW